MRIVAILLFETCGRNKFSHKASNHDFTFYFYGHSPFVCGNPYLDFSIFAFLKYNAHIFLGFPFALFFYTGLCGSFQCLYRHLSDLEPYKINRQMN